MTAEVTPIKKPKPRLKLRMSANEVFTPQELEMVRSKSNFRSLWLVAHAWIVIGLAMAMFAAFPNPITFLLAVMIIGTRQLGMAVFMHEGAHGGMHSDLKKNDWITQWFTAFPVATDLRNYRPYHLGHHKFTGQHNDPDLPLSAHFPITKESFWRKAKRDLTGQTGFKQRRAQFRAAIGKPEWPLSQRVSHFWDRLGGFVVTNSLMFITMAALGHWYLYPLLWILPLLTWFQFVTRVRNIAEHAVVPDPNDPFKNARTTRASLLERAFIAPYYVNYHVEHHLFIWIPFYRLPLAHKILMEKGYGEKMEIQPGYSTVLRKAIGRLPSDGGNEPKKPVHNMVFGTPDPAAD